MPDAKTGRANTAARRASWGATEKTVKQERLTNTIRWTPGASDRVHPGVHPLVADLARRLRDTAAKLQECDRLRSEGRADEAERIEAAAADVLRDLRQRVPVGRPVFGDAAERLNEAREPLHEVEARELALGPWRPMIVETLRSQRAFNLALQEVANELQNGAGASPAEFSRWVEETLRPLIDPRVPRIATHRTGPAASAIRTGKRLALASVSPLIWRWARAQRAWNEEAMRLLAHGAPGKPEDALARLEGLAAGIASQVQRLPRAWQEALSFQLEYGRSATLAIARHIGADEYVYDADYERWIAEAEPTAIRDYLGASGIHTPVAVSVIIGSDGSAADLRRSLESVFAQTVKPRQVCVAVSDPAQRAELASIRAPSGCAVVQAEAKDADESALWAVAASLAHGEWLCFLPCGDTLAPHTVDAISVAATRAPQVGLFFSDEDFQCGAQRRRPYFKPSFSWWSALESDEATRLLTVRRDLFARLEIRPGMGTASLYDLVLRGSRESEVSRIPLVLHHRHRDSQVTAADAGKALADHLSNDATVVASGGGWSIRRPVTGTPRVSMIVPFRDKPELTRQLLRSLERFDAGVDYEVLLLDNGSTELETARMLREETRPNIRVLRWDHPFNYSALNNFGARNARGEYLLLLNNDVEARHPGWLAEMVGFAQDPSVGAVGARLLFPDRRVQHAGVILGMGGMAAHPFWRVRPNVEWTPFGTPTRAREYLALTAACLLVRKAHYDAVGGLDESLVVSGNDVDLCLRLHRSGLRNIFTPRAELFHHESASRRGTRVRALDAWNSFCAFSDVLLEGDPFYNPNLSLTASNNAPRIDGRAALVLSAQMMLYDIKDTGVLLGRHSTLAASAASAA